MAVLYGSKRWSHKSLTLGFFEPQKRSVTERAKYAFVTFNAAFILFYVVIIGMQVTSMVTSSNCENTIGDMWSSCNLQAPFCGNLVTYGCDCAVLKMESYHDSKLPKSFRQFKSLLRLGIYSGNLSMLPDNLAEKVPYLRTLEVWNSKLESMPTGALPKTLLWLHLGGNKLSKLPEDIGYGTPELSRLNVDNNFLKELPPSIGDMTNLYTLEARGNALTVLPREMKALKNLVWLYLSKNNQ